MGNKEYDLGKRAKGRRNVIGTSPHCEEYVRLMRAGWSSRSLERYAMHRFGEDIPSRTFRLYKARKKIEVKTDPLKELELDDLPDVVVERIRVVLLQKERIAIDAAHEKSMNKLFGSLGREIELYSKLLNELRQDLIELGVLARPGSVSTVPREGDETLPGARSLAEVFASDQQVEAELAKVLHLHMRSQNGQSTNGLVS